MAEDNKNSGLTIKTLGTKRPLPDDKTDVTVADVKSKAVPARVADVLPTQDGKLRTRSQTYAASVYLKVKAIKDDSTKKKKFHKKYGGMAHKLPILICTAGLAQALVFVEGKSKDEAGWKHLLDDLSAVVGPINGKHLLKASLEEDLFTYMYLTRKTMDALVWFKRFAVSILDVKQGEEDASDETEGHLENPGVSAGVEQGAIR
jgi:CRISPR-associated protein Cmr5